MLGLRPPETKTKLEMLGDEAARRRSESVGVILVGERAAYEEL